MYHSLCILFTKALCIGLLFLRTPAAVPQTPAMSQTPADVPQTPAMSQTPADVPQTPAAVPHTPAMPQGQTPAAVPQMPAMSQTSVAVPAAAQTLACKMRIILC